MSIAEWVDLPARALRRTGPRRALLAAAAALVSIWQTWPPLVQVWTSNADYGAGPLIALLSVGWLFRASRKIPTQAEDASWKPVALLALTLCAWMVAFKANVELGKQLVAPLIIWLAVAAGAGRRAALIGAAPIFYLYFAIPVWDLVVPLLQAMTVAASHAVLGLAGVPVKIEGVLVTIPEGSFIVEEGCSGKRYLIVALAFAAFFAAINSMGRRRTLTYLGITVALALVANWVRVITVIVAGHVTNMQHYFVAREHASFGWTIFVVLLIVLWIVGHELRVHTRDVDARAPEADDTETAAPILARRTLVALALLCIPVLATAYVARRGSGSITAITLPAPALTQDWRGPLAPTREWLPQFSRAADERRWAFEAATGERVETYWATYVVQKPGAELIHYSNRLTGPRWSTLAKTRGERRLRDGGTLSVSTLLTQSREGSRWIIDYYYVVDGVPTAREWTAQLLYGVRSWIHIAPASLVAAAARCSSDCSSAERALAKYWADARFTSVTHVTDERAKGLVD